MKAWLRLEIYANDQVSTDDDPVNDDDDPVSDDDDPVSDDDDPVSTDYVQLEKQFEIPCIPPQGTRIVFLCILSDHVDAGKYHQILEHATELVTGIFTIDQIYYYVDDQRLELHAADRYENSEILKSITDQLVTGYGFTIV